MRLILLRVTLLFQLFTASTLVPNAHAITPDGLGRPLDVIEPGGYRTASSYDEAGNVLSLARPGMSAETAVYDSRSLVTERTLADGKKQRYLYDALGNLREYVDEAGESTFYDTDALGRTNKVRFADGTSEETTYENQTGMVSATRDRAGKWISYKYDDGGRVAALFDGPDPSTATKLLEYEYDTAGRLKLVKNKDAAVGYESYDLLGRPGITRAYRYAGESGLISATPAILDVHTQSHTWSIHDGERTAWRMPMAGAGSIAADDAASKWLQTIGEDRDAGGNLIRQAKATGRRKGVAASACNFARTSPTGGRHCQAIHFLSFKTEEVGSASRKILWRSGNALALRQTFGVWSVDVGIAAVNRRPNVRN